MPLTDVTAYNPLGVGGFTVTDNHGNTVHMLRYLLPSGETVDILHDDELAKLATDKLIQRRSNGMGDAETMRDFGLND